MRHFFASIDYSVLKQLLCKPPFDERTYRFLCYVIDSYEDYPGRGLPLGNQSSQWFALYYLDGIDRLVKERLHVRGYVRYMDDMVLVHHSKAYLRECFVAMRSAAAGVQRQDADSALIPGYRLPRLAPVSDGRGEGGQASAPVGEASHAQEAEGA